jgi:hypothetical protein
MILRDGFVLSSLLGDMSGSRERLSYALANCG